MSVFGLARCLPAEANSPKIRHFLERVHFTVVWCYEILMLWHNFSIFTALYILLFQCDCSGDKTCEASKANIHPCQNEVISATKQDAIVSCTTAQWICSADPLCSTALEYYNRFCQSMFRGKKCTDRCMNR